MGHYKGFTEQDFENLLKLKGKFLLSSYPSELLDMYTKKYKWNTVKIEGIPVSVSLGKQKMKTEVITENYKI